MNEDLKVCGVYGIFDTLTGECLYVGQSKNIYERRRSHFKRLRGERHLKSFTEWFISIKKDESRLDLRVLCRCLDNDDIKNKLEIFWFNELHPRFYGAVPSENNKWSHSEETRKKIGRGVVWNFDKSGKSRKPKRPKPKKLKPKRLKRLSSERKARKCVKGSRFPGRASCNVYFYTCEMCNIEFASSKKKACEHIFCSKSCSHAYSKFLKMDTLDYKKVKDLYESGVTQVKIAKMFDVSNATVSKFMRDNGISTKYKRHDPGLKRKSRKASNADVV
jgi:GIY-YIG catalytic domain protein